MADPQPTASRRAMLAALAAAPLASLPSPVGAAAVDRSAWDKALAQYELLRMLAQADLEIGAMFKANEEHLAVTIRLGDKGRHLPEARDAMEALRAAEGLRHKRYLKSYWQAAQRLALTPAPDLAALAYKIELMRDELLHCDPGMPRNCMAIVEEDAKRLAAGIA